MWNGLKWLYDTEDRTALELTRDLIIALILGMVEGATEFVPVSSTGHLIIAGHLLDFTGTRASTFEIFIQLGAILAVAMLYKDRILLLFTLEPRFPGTPKLAGMRGLALLGLTTLPALVLGVVSYATIKAQLFNPTTVAIGLGLGGVAILLVEPRVPEARFNDLDALSWREALGIGMFQCLALWPGVSRAAATILGGMLLGLDRKTSAEYSFLVALPTILAAVGYDLVQNLGALQITDVPLFATGFAAAFLAAWMAVTFFLRLLASNSLRSFGWYRIAVALFVLTALV